MLAFTIKQKNSGKRKSQPPKTLQFYNDNFSHPVKIPEDFDKNEVNSEEIELNQIVSKKSISLNETKEQSIILDPARLRKISNDSI